MDISLVRLIISSLMRGVVDYYYGIMAIDGTRSAAPEAGFLFPRLVPTHEATTRYRSVARSESRALWSSDILCKTPNSLAPTKHGQVFIDSRNIDRGWRGQMAESGFTNDQWSYVPLQD